MTWRKLWWLALLLGCQPVGRTFKEPGTKLDRRIELTGEPANPPNRDPRWTLTDYLHALEAQKP